MGEQGSEKLSVRRVNVQMPTPQDKLQRALEEYVRDVRKPPHLADEAYRAVIEVVGTPENPPTP